MIKRMVIMLVGVGIVLGGFFGFQNFKAHIIQQVMASHGQSAADRLNCHRRLSRNGSRRSQAVGSLRAVNGADLSLEVAGIVEQINFNSGDDVAAGAVLVQLRDGRRCGEAAGACRPPPIWRRSPMTATRSSSRRRRSARRRWTPTRST